MTDEFQGPIEIAPGTFWVGQRLAGGVFFANPYVRVFEGTDAKSGRPVQFNLLVDPGSSSDFATVRAKTEAVVGGLDRLTAVFINHQDPDVCSVAPLLFGRLAPHAHILCSEDTWRLIVHMNLPKERFLATEKFPRGFRVQTGHRLVPVPSPYCHFVGAVMLYDPETRVLFSGDLFGGLTAENASGLWADESDWPGMRAFHQIYMPHGQALAMAVESIRNLDPPVEIIAPQHGRLLRGEWVGEYLDRISHLRTGIEVLEDRRADPSTLEAWSSVLRRVVHTARGALGPMAQARLMESRSLADTVRWDASRPTVTSLGKWSVEEAVRILTSGEPPAVANPVKYEALMAASELELPTPAIPIELEERASPGVGNSLVSES